METLQADRPVGALVQGQPWWKQKRVLYGVGGVAALALLVVVLMAIWPPTQADPGAAAVTPERAGIGQSKAVVRPEEGKRSHEKKSGGASTVPPEVKPASGVVLPAANGGATALANPGAVVPPGGDPVQVPGTQPPSGPIVVTGPEGAVPEGQNPIKVVPAAPKSETPKSEKPKAVVPTSPKAPPVQPTAPKEPNTPVVPGTPTSPVAPQTPTTPESLKTPEAKGPADPKSPITPSAPIQSPATDGAVPGTPGTAKKDPKRPRKSMWSEPDMEGMEDEMKKELKKSLEMWQLDPNGESGIEME